MYNCVLCKLKCNEVRYLKELVSLQVVRFSWWCGWGLCVCGISCHTTG